MQKTKEDKRVRYTKIFLKESLLKCLKKKPLARITVTELCKDADINRATYYAHYRDPFDQFDRLEEDFISGLDDYLGDLLDEPHTKKIRSILKKVFTYINENRQLCLVLFGEHGDMRFEEKLISSLKKYVFAAWNTDIPEDDTIDEYKYIYVISGSIGLVRKWLFEDANKRSMSEIVGLLLKVSSMEKY